MISSIEKAKLCVSILKLVNLERFWPIPDIGDDHGPSLDMWEELAFIVDDCSRLSHGEKIVLRVTVDIWNGAASVPLSEMLTYLDPPIVHRIADVVKLCLPLPDLDW